MMVGISASAQDGYKSGWTVELGPSLTTVKVSTPRYSSTSRSCSVRLVNGRRETYNCRPGIRGYDEISESVFGGYAEIGYLEQFGKWYLSPSARAFFYEGGESIVAGLGVGFGSEEERFGAVGFFDFNSQSVVVGPKVFIKVNDDWGISGTGLFSTAGNYGEFSANAGYYSIGATFTF